MNFPYARIYERVCLVTGERYIGSTHVKYDSTKKAQQKADYINYKKGEGKHGYWTLCDLFDRGEPTFDILEECPCNTEEEKWLRERYWQETLECVNIDKPINTIEERKALLAKASKVYHDKNREKTECEICGRMVTKYKMTSHQQRDICKKKNVTKLEKVECTICGSVVCTPFLVRHQKTKKCLNFVKSS